MKKFYFSFLFVVCILLNAQNIMIVPGSGTDFGNHMIYKNSLYYMSPNYFLGKYDGTNSTLIPFQNGINGMLFGQPLMMNNEIYYTTSGGNAQNRIIKFDGTTQTVIENNNSTDAAIQPFNFNNELHTLYRSSAKNYIAKYDGSKMVPQPNPNTNDYGITALVDTYNGEQYFSYGLENGAIKVLAKYNGTNITLIPNINAADSGTDGTKGIVFNNNLYFAYYTADHKRHLARYDGTSITIVDQFASNEEFGYSPMFVYQNKIYLTGFKNAASFLCTYDGTTFTKIPNFNTTDSGPKGFGFVFKNKLYMSYQTTAGLKMARTDGTAYEFLNISYMPQDNKSAIVTDNFAYFPVGDGIAKYDGNTIVTTFKDPTNTALELMELTPYNDNIFLRFSTTNSDIRFGYIKTSLMATTENSDKKIILYPNPFSEKLNISTQENGVVNFYDTTGKMIKSQGINKGKNEISGESLLKGVYLYQVKNTNGEIISSGKVIKK